ncbi:MAG: hypothetical protein V8S82_05165 [Eubacteriales bacterium]
MPGYAAARKSYPRQRNGQGISPSDRENVRRFAETLTKNHIVATVRRHLGGDIDASCGQLRAKTKNENSRIIFHTKREGLETNEILR